MAPASESPASLFADFISEQVVQTKCINCHVDGGVSGHTRLVFIPSSAEGHQSQNLAALADFVTTVVDAVDLVLNKIQGVAHGGGIQVPAGSAEFANMERFLRLLGGDGGTSNGLSPETLFDGVTLTSPARTVRRAAVLFAGRLPTDQELGAVNDGHDSSLRRTIRSMMVGPRFHEFLIRAGNDRLLTDRHVHFLFDPADAKEFPEMTNMHWELGTAALNRGYSDINQDPTYWHWKRAMHFGLARAPLELIAHVVESDLPYTEVLTADYIMANAMVAEGYGAETEFDDAGDPTEFKPSEIVSYYRNDDSKILIQDDKLGVRVINPGNLITDYPHAGILNTTVFLRRYPSTATNRNRARSRWTYYHFLGVDVEKSAARTTDPEALADTNNPTLNNPSCTVCHRVLDPVAGAFQNYGDEGLYRHKWGGLDSLAELYKYPEDGSVSPYQEGDTWYRDMLEPGFGNKKAPSPDNSLSWLAEQIANDDRFAEAAVKFWWPALMGVEIADPPEDESDRDFAALLLASTAQAGEVNRLAKVFKSGIAGGRPFNLKDLLTEIVLSPWFRAETFASDDPIRYTALRYAGVERLLTPEELNRKTEAVSGYVWGRRFRMPYGLNQPLSYLDHLEGWKSYGLLYGGIDSDGIVKRMGDITPLMAAVAQSHAAEVSCPIVQREFFLWPEENRRLFNGIDKFDTPVSEASSVYEVKADSWESHETLSLSVQLSAGSKTIRLTFENPYSDEVGDDRHLNLLKLGVRDESGTLVSEFYLGGFDRQHRCWPEQEGDRAFYRMLGGCSLDLPLQVSASQTYSISVTAFQKQLGSENARLAVQVESMDGTSRGELAIRRTLVDLHHKLFGVSVATDSPDVEAAYSLFVETWDRKRRTEGTDFRDSQFTCAVRDHLYFEGLANETVFEFDPDGKWNHSRIAWDRARPIMDRANWSDPNHVVRAWVVTLAYLLSDYRYLYL